MQIREMDELVAAEAEAAGAGGMIARNSSSNGVSEGAADTPRNGTITNAAATALTAADARRRLQGQPLQRTMFWWRRRRRQRRKTRRRTLLQTGAAGTHSGAAAERESWHAEGKQPAAMPLLEATYHAFLHA